MRLLSKVFHRSIPVMRAAVCQCEGSAPSLPACATRLDPAPKHLPTLPAPLSFKEEWEGGKRPPCLGPQYDACGAFRKCHNTRPIPSTTLCTENA